MRELVWFILSRCTLEKAACVLGKIKLSASRIKQLYLQALNELVNITIWCEARELDKCPTCVLLIQVSYCNCFDITCF